MPQDTPPPLPISFQSKSAKRPWYFIATLIALLSVFGLFCAFIAFGFWSLGELRKISPRDFLKLSDDLKKATLDDIERAPEKYNPVIILLAADYAYSKGLTQKAQFWHLFGQNRLRYDAFRCTDVTAQQAVPAIIINLNPKLVSGVYKMPKSQALVMAKEVIELDNKTPQDYDFKWAVSHGMKALAPAFGEKPQENSFMPESEWPKLKSRLHNGLIKSIENPAPANGA